MTKSEYIQFHKQMTQRMIDITLAKNSDYTAGSNDPFANFTRGETASFGRRKTEDGFLFRMDDKFSRLESFVAKGTLQVKDESVQDTLIDLANYCILLAAYINSKRPQPSPSLVTKTAEFIPMEAEYLAEIHCSDGDVSRHQPRGR